MLVIYGNLQGECVSAMHPAAAPGEARFVNNGKEAATGGRRSASGRARAPAGGRTVRAAERLPPRRFAGGGRFNIPRNTSGAQCTCTDHETPQVKNYIKGEKKTMGHEGKLL